MVMDAMVRHWASLVEERAGGKYGCGMKGRNCGAFLTWIME